MRSAWFRGKLEGRLAMRTRLAWTVGEASWSPWGGLRLGAMKAVAAGPEAHRIPPIVEIAEVRVRPYWKDLLSGRVRIRELRVTGPRAKVPLELLVQLMRSDGRVDTARLGGEGGGATAGPKPDPKPAPAEDGGATKPPPAPERPAAARESPGPGELDREPEVEPSGRLVVEGGELEFYLLSAPEKGLRLAGLRMDVPFSGGEADGLVEAAELRLAGEVLVAPVKLPVGWKEGVIEWPAGEFTWRGLTVQTAGAVRIRGRLLGSLELRVVAPALEPQPVPGWESASFATGPLEMRGRLLGDMIRPVTWRGNLVAGVQGVQLMHPERGEAMIFDQARLVTDLRGGVLQLVDATLKGEQLSLFGNGLMVLDGRIYGVGRVVAAPDLAETIARVAAGSMVSRGYVEAWMAPLGTPDRYYRDVYVRGTIQESEFDLGPDGQWMDGDRTMQLIRMFVTREEAEERLRIEEGEEDGGA
jgi:hypothetical protein